MQADVGWSRSTIVGVLTDARLVDGAAGLWLGPLIDRHGARVHMPVSAAMGGTCLIAIALVEAPWQSYVLWALFGVAMPGLATLGPIAAISNWFIRKRAQAIMFYTFGSATAGLFLAPAMAAVADAMSWRTAWVLMGLLLWLIAPLAWLTVRQRPEDLGLEPDGGAAPAPKGPVRVQPAPERAPEDYWTVRRALRSRSFWLLTMGFMLTTLPASSIFIHMSAFVQSKGFSIEAGAAAVSIYCLGAVAGRFVWGFTVARAGLYRALVAWAALYGARIFLYTLPSSLSAL
jgi:sugar phosphate permease